MPSKLLPFSRSFSFLTLLSAWDEIQEVFGDGHDYDWALAADEEDIGMTEEVVKPDMRYQDVCSSPLFLNPFFLMVYSRSLNPLK